MRAARPETDFERAIRAHYETGMSDYETAACLGVERWRVQAWRRRFALPARSKSFAQRAAVPPFCANRAAKLHAAGLSDVALAAALSCHRSTVARWRSRTGRQANGQRFFAAAYASRPALRDPLWSACRAAISNRVAPDVADDAVSDMVLDVLEGRLARDDVAGMGRRYGNRALDRWADSRKMASLDDDRRGYGWSALARRPDPDAETSHRLVELCHLAELRGIDWRAVLS